MRKWLFSFFGSILPERLIRTLFLSSLYSYLFGVKEADICVCQRLNRVLNVCENDYALGVGIHLSQSFWEGRDTNCTIRSKFHRSALSEYPLTKDNEKKVIRDIIERTPKWLHYNMFDMYNDVQNMIQKRSEINA